MRLTNQYIAGTLDWVGGFRIVKIKGKRKTYEYPVFIVRFLLKNKEKYLLAKKIFDKLKKDRGIEYNHYVTKAPNQHYFEVLKKDSIKKLVKFMEKYCKLKRYKR